MWEITLPVFHYSFQKNMVKSSIEKVQMFLHRYVSTDSFPPHSFPGCIIWFGIQGGYLIPPLEQNHHLKENTSLKLEIFYSHRENTNIMVKVNSYEGTSG